MKKVLREIMGETAYKRWLLEPHGKELKLLMKKQKKDRIQKAQTKYGNDQG